MKVKSRTWNGQPAIYAHLKRDGHFISIEKNEFGSVRVLTPTPVDITHQLKQCGWLGLVYRRVQCNTRILGELWYPGKPASYIKTALKERDAKLQLGVFAVATAPANWPLEDIENMCAAWSLPFIPYTRNFDPHTLLQDLPRDAEGYVLKDGNMLNWYKLKPVNTIDLIVHDFKDGNGELIGLVGALVCKTAEGHVIANVSGMDMATRVDITSNDIGRVAEVRYQYVGAKGKLRHPAFVRWRDDKKPADCTLDQDDALQEYWNEVR